MTTVDLTRADNDNDRPDEQLMLVRIYCAEAQTLLVPARLRLPTDLAQSLLQALADGAEADDFDPERHPAIARLYDWLDYHREAWEQQIDYGLHCQDGEDLEIRDVSYSVLPPETSPPPPPEGGVPLPRRVQAEPPDDGPLPPSPEGGVPLPR
ncbi:hypothetical protein [Streptacidiphilus melanogenes]|uniref:hypothetical protein n=1 Tax=Streptacidiphilus melanogenes TaxID=411235 RepID=UPI0005A6E7B9|nr:hypothetical protein [Streptacidiphilus melanogenes]